MIGAVLAFVPGLAVGSVLNTLASQFPKHEVRLRLRATCRRCGHELGLVESVALLAYLRRGGRCSRCGAKRSVRYPLLELTMGLLAAACFIHFGFTGRAFVGTVFCAVLLLLAAIDLERRILPNAIVLPAAIFILLADILVAPHRAAEWALSAAASGLGLLALALLYRGALGMGDVKLAFMLGAGLGAAVIVAFLVGLVAAFVGASVILWQRGVGARKESIPLGPFLALGAIVTLLGS